MSDVFRKEYRAIQKDNVELIASIKDKAAELNNLLGKVFNREMSLAKTWLETSVMWATKAIALEDEKNSPLSEHESL